MAERQALLGGTDAYPKVPTGEQQRVGVWMQRKMATAVSPGINFVDGIPSVTLEESGLKVIQLGKTFPGGEEISYFSRIRPVAALVEVVDDGVVFHRLDKNGAVIENSHHFTGFTRGAEFDEAEKGNLRQLDGRIVGALVNRRGFYPEVVQLSLNPDPKVLAELPVGASVQLSGKYEGTNRTIRKGEREVTIVSLAVGKEGVSGYVRGGAFALTDGRESEERVVIAGEPVLEGDTIIALGEVNGSHKVRLDGVFLDKPSAQRQERDAEHREAVQKQLTIIRSAFLGVYHIHIPEPTYFERRELHRQGREAIATLHNEPGLTRKEKEEFLNLIEDIAPERLPIPFKEDDPNVAELNRYIVDHPYTRDGVEEVGPINTMDSETVSRWIFDLAANHQTEILPFDYIANVVRGYYEQEDFSDFLGRAITARMTRYVGKEAASQDIEMVHQMVPWLAIDGSAQSTNVALDILNFAAFHRTNPSVNADMDILMAGSVGVLRYLINENTVFDASFEGRVEKVVDYLTTLQTDERIPVEARQEFAGLLETITARSKGSDIKETVDVDDVDDVDDGEQSSGVDATRSRYAGWQTSARRSDVPQPRVVTGDRRRLPTAEELTDGQTPGGLPIRKRT